MILVFSACTRETKTAEQLWQSGSVLYDVGNFDGAIEQYNKIIKYYPGDDYALKADFAIADIYKNNIKDYNKAIEHYKAMEKKYPDSEKTPNAIFMIGYIYANELQDNDKAREAYEYFIENYPDNVLVQSARWEIENLGKSLEEIQQTTVTD
jgi:TolA-binding protein